jgi:hypothetical protein
MPTRSAKRTMFFNMLNLRISTGLRVTYSPILFKKSCLCARRDRCPTPLVPPYRFLALLPAKLNNASTLNLHRAGNGNVARHG